MPSDIRHPDSSRFHIQVHNQVVSRLLSRGISCIRSKVQTLQKGHSVGRALVPKCPPVSFDSLSDEVIREILLYLRLHLRIRRATGLLPEGIIVSSRNSGGMRKVRHILSSVCSRWKNILLETPAMWSTIILDDWKDLNETYLSDCLIRSKAYPLEVWVRPWTKSPDCAFGSLLSLLRDHLWRISVFQGDLLPQEIEIFFPYGETHIIPMAKRIAIYEINSGKTKKPTGLIIPASCLTHMFLIDAILLSYFAWSQPYPSLKYLSLTSVTGLVPCSQFLEFLQLCPNLCRLHIYNTSLDYSLTGVSYWPTTRYTLSHVTEFWFSICYHSDALLFVRSLHLPQLKFLRVTDLRTNYLPHKYLINSIFWWFLQEYSDTLEDVDLHEAFFPIGKNVAETLLRKLERLTDIAITSISLPPGFLNIFLPEKDDPTKAVAFPNLQLLYLKQLDIEDETLIEIIKLRSWPDSKEFNDEQKKAVGQRKSDASPAKEEVLELRGRRKLKDVVVEGCVFLEDSVFEAFLVAEQVYSKVLEIRR